MYRVTVEGMYDLSEIDRSVLTLPRITNRDEGVAGSDRITVKNLASL
jgi:hypothetical protein